MSTVTLDFEKPIAELEAKLAEWEAAIDKIDEKELSTEEALLFNEVNLRIATKLNKAALTMN